MPSSDVKRKVKLITEQHINHNKAPVEGLPMRDWSIEVVLVNDKGDDLPASIFDKITFELHPSFGKRAKQAKKDAPFRIEESGWGEFELLVHFTPAGTPASDKKSEITVAHDLNFGENRYEVVHDLTFKNPKPEFLRALDEVGMGVENGLRKGDGKKRVKKDKNVDMEKLADGLQKMTEEDLLHVVQMIHDMKSSETYVKNDPDGGEFHVDLYTLPDPLVKQLWDFTASKVEL